jgi:hypothetical protein
MILIGGRLSLVSGKQIIDLLIFSSHRKARDKGHQVSIADLAERSRASPHPGDLERRSHADPDEVRRVAVAALDRPQGFV